ncbi:MAG TPA: class I SAM-dependent methyltransferase [Vicinamibacterales bacterium]|nr:class I SAM-dependent methyltransferase [Vicinamibacterales bacterium]
MDKRRGFEFGENWLKFLAVVDDVRIDEAANSLRALLNVSELKGRRFLDIGCGSGLLSLAARRLGAHVHSFDIDDRSVECTKRLRNSYCPDDTDWTIEQGSALDEGYLRSLGVFDIVYSWGVLHHTGAMWVAIKNAQAVVAEEGLFYVAIYNKQPFLSTYWTAVKRLYNRAPGLVKAVMRGGFAVFFASASFVADLLRVRDPSLRYRGIGRRGMSTYRDVVDWIGGWPFEVATPEEVFRAFRDAGFTLRELKTCAGKHGCNEFVFFRSGSPTP